ncbi:MAG: efflux RND transporter periplasmic adaptor subunit, partial [Myxococcota bacterium]
MKIFLKYVLPFVVLAAGVGVFMLLFKSRPEQPRTARSDEGLLVEVATLESSRQEVNVRARGQVIPAQRAVMAPQVTGTVRWMADGLVPGGRFRQGETLLRLDSRDYRLALESQEANLSAAGLELQLERGRQVVAEREWQVFGAPEGTAGSEASQALARRQPQLDNAQVAVSAAESGVERARLDLSRTRLTAPFNAMVLAENVDRGQLIGPTSQAVTLVGTDTFWVEMALPVDQLAALRIPGAGAAEGEGSAATVRQSIGGQDVERQGRVLRLLPDLDPAGSMARLLVGIDDPLGLDAEDAAGIPLLLGSYVEVDLEATPLEGVIEVPRYAVREGDRAFVMNDERKLEVRELDVAWGRRDTVLVRGGRRAGEQLVTSRVPNAVPGLSLRTGA